LGRPGPELVIPGGPGHVQSTRSTRVVHQMGGDDRVIRTPA
jgi:hypothetical protein